MLSHPRMYRYKYILAKAISATIAYNGNIIVAISILIIVVVVWAVKTYHGLVIFVWKWHSWLGCITCWHVSHRVSHCYFFLAWKWFNSWPSHCDTYSFISLLILVLAKSELCPHWNIENREKSCLFNWYWNTKYLRSDLWGFDWANFVDHED